MAEGAMKMAGISRFEFETGADFSTLSQKNRLRALRILGDLLPEITKYSLSFAHDVKTAGHDFAAAPIHDLHSAMAAVGRLDARISEIAEEHPRRVFASIKAACDLLKELGLKQAPANRTKQ